MIRRRPSWLRRPWRRTPALVPPVIAIAALALIAVAAAVAVRRLPGPEPAAAPVDTVDQPDARPDAPPPAPAPRPAQPVAFSDGCVTPECHATLTTRASSHEPAARGACDVCHGPEEGDHTYPLLRPEDAVCASCHDIGRQRRFQHQALSGDACLACHDPHGSDGPDLLMAGSTSATCAQCHPPAQGIAVHEPYRDGACDACHDPHGADNRALLLVGEGAEHCRLCHTETVHAVETLAFTHRDVEGSCRACHSAHTTDQPGLLTAEPRQLCVTCHSDVGDTVETATVSHDPVLAGDQCVTCHEPHASEHVAMLRETQAQMCLSCHDEPQIAADGRTIPEMATAIATAPVVHGAVREGDCSACHSIHGSRHARLLRAVDPAVLTSPFDARNYALCFACHDPDLATEPNATLFRDGRRNLHQAHLPHADTLGSCRDCHAVHTGVKPRLIAERIDYQGSGWVTPMGFVLTEDGGRCAPGCHEPLSYSRRSDDAPPRQTGGSP